MTKEQVELMTLKRKAKAFDDIGELFIEKSNRGKFELAVAEIMGACLAQESIQLLKNKLRNSNPLNDDLK